MPPRRNERTSRRGYPERFRRGAVRHYVESRASYRDLARLLRTEAGASPSKSTLNRWVLETAAGIPTPLELTASLPGCWSGRLSVDGKAVRFHDGTGCVLIAVDQGTRDLVHADVVADETKEAFIGLLSGLCASSDYRIEALVTDAAPGFLTGWQTMFTPSVPLQLCRVHFLRHLDWAIPKAHRSPTAAARAELKDRIRDVLFAATPSEAARRFYALTDDQHRYRDLGVRYDPIDALRRRFGLYMTHHYVPGLPADTNVTENVVRVLAKKLAQMETLASPDTARAYLKVLAAAYRTRPFTDGTPATKGRSPLQLAGITSHPNWQDLGLTSNT